MFRRLTLILLERRLVMATAALERVLVQKNFTVGWYRKNQRGDERKTENLTFSGDSIDVGGTGVLEV